MLFSTKAIWAALIPISALVSSSPISQEQVAKRAPGIGQIRRIISQNSVGTDEWGFLPSEHASYPKYLGTNGLDGCTAVVVCSSKGCFLGHFRPDVEIDPNRPWKESLEEAYCDREASVAFEGGSAWIVAGLQGSYEYKWQVDQIKAWLCDKGIPSTEEPYLIDHSNLIDFPEIAEEMQVPGENIYLEQSPALGTVLIGNVARGRFEFQVEGKLV